MPLRSKPNGVVIGFRCLTTPGLDRDSLSPKIQRFIDEQERVCKPDNVYVCDGSEAENKALLSQLLKDGRIEKLEKYDNWYAFQTYRSKLFPPTW